jgi:hypothetical protein
MTEHDPTEHDPELKALVEDWCDACEFGDMKAYVEQLDQGQLKKLVTYLAAVARKCGLGLAS